MPQMSLMQWTMMITMSWSMILMFMIMNSHSNNNYLKKMKTSCSNKNMRWNWYQENHKLQIYKNRIIPLGTYNMNEYIYPPNKK